MKEPLEMKEIRKDCAHHGKSCPCGACRTLFNYDLMVERFEAEISFLKQQADEAKED